MDKTCTKCLQTKPETEFSWKVVNVRRATQCKDCHREYRKKHYQLNRDYYINRAKAWREASGRSGQSLKHNISDEYINELKDKFDGLCWICKTRPATEIDHDHGCCSVNTTTTCGNCVRGVLCGPCNRGIGFLMDDPVILETAAAYLRTYAVANG